MTTPDDPGHTLLEGWAWKGDMAARTLTGDVCYVRTHLGQLLIDASNDGGVAPVEVVVAVLRRAGALGPGVGDVCEWLEGEAEAERNERANPAAWAHAEWYDSLASRIRSHFATPGPTVEDAPTDGEVVPSSPTRTPGPTVGDVCEWLETEEGRMERFSDNLSSNPRGTLADAIRRRFVGTQKSHCKYHKEGLGLCMHCHPPPGHVWDQERECVVPAPGRNIFGGIDEEAEAESAASIVRSEGERVHLWRKAAGEWARANFGELDDARHGRGDTAARGFLAGLAHANRQLREALGGSEPWPLENVLEKLADAACMLLDRHNHDGADHTTIRIAEQKARKYAGAVRRLLADLEKETKKL